MIENKNMGLAARWHSFNYMLLILSNARKDGDYHFGFELQLRWWRVRGISVLFLQVALQDGCVPTHDEAVHECKAQFRRRSTHVPT